MLFRSPKSNAKSHGLFFPVFIHRILLDLGLVDFLAFEPIRIIAPIGATFLWQRAVQLKASSKCTRVESSTDDASRALPSGDPIAEDFVEPITICGSSTIYIILFVYAYHT